MIVLLYRRHQPGGVLLAVYYIEYRVVCTASEDRNNSKEEKAKCGEILILKEGLELDACALPLAARQTD